ncbi:MAG: LPS export ABC transporter periplasmic protein LptC, partial [Elusimicrobia bacterium]|nr:LPS export ABC transporter periplasmic protein LptC [Elusimicrobiota bacterium]
PPAAEARQTMQDFTMTQTAKGVRIWTLAAPQARVAMGGSALLDHPEIRFYRSGQHASTARSRQGFVRGDGRDVSLVGDVVITAIGDKTTLKTEHLDYSASDQRFKTQDPVLVERPGAVLRGTGMEADAGLNDITIFRQETRIR